jgi:hypothetical protein
LFGVVGKVLVKPNLLRDVVEDFETFQMEEASVRRKMDNNKIRIPNGEKLFFRKCQQIFYFFCNLGTYKLTSETTNLRKRNEDKNSSSTPSRLCGDLNDLYSVKPMSSLNDHEKSLLELQIQASIPNKRNIAEVLLAINGQNGRKNSIETTRLVEQLRELDKERNELLKRKSASIISRNIIYPIAMILLLCLTSITILLVLLNIVEILIGFKALPLSLDSTARVSLRNS